MTGLTAHQQLDSTFSLMAFIIHRQDEMSLIRRGPPRVYAEEHKREELYPLQHIYLDNLYYRWSKFGPEASGYGMSSVYNEIEHFIATHAKPPTGHFQKRYEGRYPAIVGMCNNLRIQGMLNYLIVFRPDPKDPPRYLVTKGNQRLCALKIFWRMIQNKLNRSESLEGWEQAWHNSILKGIPCRETTDMRSERPILRLHPYKEV